MKKIGIPGWVIENKVFGVNLPYANYIRKFGKLIVLEPEEVRDDLDLLVLPGGADIFIPNQSFSLYTQSHNSSLEYFDKNSLPAYIENDTPIIGICRGAQRLYSMFGGELNQHYPNHTQSNYPTDECHGLFFTPPYKHFEKFAKEVNSRHHQIMVPNLKNSQIEIIAYGSNYIKNSYHIDPNIVEIFKVADRNILGVQYHPEDCITETFTERAIHNFLNKKTI